MPKTIESPRKYGARAVIQFLYSEKATRIVVPSSWQYSAAYCNCNKEKPLKNPQQGKRTRLGSNLGLLGERQWCYPLTTEEVWIRGATAPKSQHGQPVAAKWQKGHYVSKAFHNFNFSFLNQISLLLISNSHFICPHKAGCLFQTLGPICPEEFIRYSRKSNLEPLEWQSDLLTQYQKGT